MKQDDNRRPAAQTIEEPETHRAVVGRHQPVIRRLRISRATERDVSNARVTTT
jgi:ribosomal protein S14